MAEVEDDSADLVGDALDELDDLFDDEDLYQDLEELGKFLDELGSDEEDETSDDLGTSKEPKQEKKPKAQGNEGALGADKIHKALAAGDEPSIKSEKVEKEEEREDGEILEDEEKDELKELQKKKSEIVNKMKKLVRHKIQLTTQRNDLLLQLQSNSQLDKVNTLLKENSLLVKAISNQIFRMNPEIKLLNTKIKDLEASVGSQICGDNRTAEDIPPEILTSKRDLKNIENFFDRLSGRSKQAAKAASSQGSPAKSYSKSVENFFDRMSKNDKRDDEEKVQKGERKSPLSKCTKEEVSLNKSPNFDANRALMKSVLSQPDKSAGNAPAGDLKRTPRLISDKSKIKNIFDKVCEMTEKKRESTSSSLESSANPSENIKESGTPTSDSIESSINFKLKEIRQNVTCNTPTKVDLVDLTTKKIPVISGPRSSPPGGDEWQGKKRKHVIEVDFDKPSSSSLKKTKIESPLSNSIPKSLMDRLGSPPAKGTQQRTPNNKGSYEDLDAGEYYSDTYQAAKREMPAERKGYWCQCCNRAFNSTQAYVTHLESPKHLRIAMAGLDRKQGLKLKGDSAVAVATKNDGAGDDDNAWYKGKSKGNDKRSPVSVNADTEEDSCIAVVGIDTFCKKKKLGHSHVRCFAHAKCLTRKENLTLYSPDLCSVCLEYIKHSHSSVKCCEKIFRIFKFFRQRFGFSFDWENKYLKDWFFDNYRKIQSSDAKTVLIPYEELIAEQKLNDVKKQENKDLVKDENSRSPSHEPASSTEVKSCLCLLLDKIQSGDSIGGSTPPIEKDIPLGDALCSFIENYSGVEKTKALEKNKPPNVKPHSYSVCLDKCDPFITEICESLEETCVIPSPKLLSSFHAQFTTKNLVSQTIMNFLNNEPLQLSDISFEVGGQKGCCSKELMEKLNFTIRVAKSQFNCYAAFRALGLAVERFSIDNSPSPKVKEFHKCLMESMCCLAKEMVNPLKYYIQLAILDKQRLRRTGFVLPCSDKAVSTFVRHKIFSKSLFEGAVLKTLENSKHLAELLNKQTCEKSSCGEQSDGVGVLASKEIVQHSLLM